MINRKGAEIGRHNDVFATSGVAIHSLHVKLVFSTDRITSTGVLPIDRKIDATNRLVPVDHGATAQSAAGAT